MKKGIRGHDVNAKGLENICKKCCENDIEYLQLVLEKSIENFEFGMFSKEYAAEIAAKLGNMKTAILGSYINPSSTDKLQLENDIEMFKEKIKYASILKPIAVGTETGFYGSVMSDELNSSEEAYQHLLCTMQKLVSEAEKYGVNIAIEGVHCFVINTPQRMRRIIDDLNSDNVKVIFDPVNYLNAANFQNQDKIINDTFDLLSDKIVALHIKDFVCDNGIMKEVIPGKGILNYKLIFNRLKAENMDIPLISEGHSVEDAKKGFMNLSAIKQ